MENLTREQKAWFKLEAITQHLRENINIPFDKLQEKTWHLNRVLLSITESAIFTDTVFNALDRKEIAPSLTGNVNYGLGSLRPRGGEGYCRSEGGTRISSSLLCWLLISYGGWRNWSYLEGVVERHLDRVRFHLRHPDDLATLKPYEEDTAYYVYLFRELVLYDERGGPILPNEEAASVQRPIDPWADSRQMLRWTEKHLEELQRRIQQLENESKLAQLDQSSEDDVCHNCMRHHCEDCEVVTVEGEESEESEESEDSMPDYARPMFIIQTEPADDVKTETATKPSDDVETDEGAKPASENPTEDDDEAKIAEALESFNVIALEIQRIQELTAVIRSLPNQPPRELKLGLRPESDSQASALAKTVGTEDQLETGSQTSKDARTSSPSAHWLSLKPPTPILSSRGAEL